MVRRICFDTEPGGRKITHWLIVPEDAKREPPHPEGKHWPCAIDLHEEPTDIWWLNQPIELAEQALYMLAEYQWPQEAIIAIADLVYSMKRAPR